MYPSSRCVGPLAQGGRTSHPLPARGEVAVPPLPSPRKMSMTEETRSEKSVGLPYLHMVLVGVLFLLLMLIKFEDPLPEWRTPLTIVLSVALVVSALLLGGRSLKKD